MTIIDLPATSDSPAPANRYVACFDVLGFKNLVETRRLEDLANEYVVLTKRAVHDNGTIVIGVGPTGNLRGGRYGFPCVVFSDTLVLWCADDNTAAQAFLTSCAHLLNASVAAKLPLRGGIAFGECIMDRSTSTFMGRALVDAYITEQSQEWIGAVLHDTCFPRAGSTGGPSSNISTSCDLVRCLVPTKQGCQEAHALKWHHYGYFDSVLDNLSKMKAAAHESVRHKFDNTIRFVNVHPI